MIKKKICMLGSFGVGKTSLTSKFVLNMFSEKYHTTIGVKVDKKIVKVDETDLTLMLWDMAGEEENLPIKLSYVRDAAGYFLVLDGTRKQTLDVGISIQERIRTQIRDLPFVVAINKFDQVENWEIPESQLAELAEKGWPLFKTSAKSGEQVELAFLKLAGLTLKGARGSAPNVVGEPE
ncbi:MAG: Rab family GTPase [Bryobacteraceae bacterium]